MATALDKSKTINHSNMAIQCEQLQDDSGVAINLTELSAITGNEIAFLDGVTEGVVTASKAVVVDSNKDVGDLRNLDCTNLDAGLSGTAGTVDVFPSTAAMGKTAYTAADNAGDTTTTIVNGSMAAARTLTYDDPGGAADFAFTDYQVSLTANTDGGAASTISAGVQSVVMAANNTDTDDWILLPAGVAGRRIRGWSVVAHEMRTVAASNATINTVDADGGTNELAIPATTLWEAFCVATDTWVVTAQDELGADIAALVPDAV